MEKSTAAASPLGRLLKLKYHLLPGRFEPGFGATDFYNEVFEFWLQFWERVLKDNGSQDTFDPYDFLISDLVAVLANGNEIVSIHLYSFFNIEQNSIRFHPYLSGPEERSFLGALHENRYRSAMSFEFLTLNEN